jgi:hypothetical protein
VNLRHAVSIGERDFQPVRIEPVSGQQLASFKKSALPIGCGAQNLGDELMFASPPVARRAGNERNGTMRKRRARENTSRPSPIGLCRIRGWLYSRRWAARVNPVVALRHE